MSFHHETQSTQTEESSKFTIQKVKNSCQFYSKRFNVDLIKAKLYELVPDDEYWETFSQFVYGVCSKERFDEVTSLYLRTNESKLFHNDLIKAILFNAHYSLIPPPGIHVTRKPKIEQKVKKISCSHIIHKNDYPLSFTELGVIPSPSKLSERIRLILLNNNFADLNIDKSSTDFIYKELINFISYIFTKAIKTACKDYMNPKDFTLSSDQISHILRSDEHVMEFLSSKSYEKISLLSSFAKH